MMEEIDEALGELTEAERDFVGIDPRLFEEEAR